MFVERMSPAEKESLYQTAAEGATLIEKFDVPWWLSHGTLLGAWRHHGVIPWDDDLDFSFPRARLGEFEAYVRSKQWKFHRLGPFLAKIWNPAHASYHNNLPWTWPFIDLTLYDEYGSKLIIEHHYHSSFDVFERSELLPTFRSPFGPLELPLPNSPERMLDVIFPLWKTSPTSSSYNHRFERPYSEPRERKSIHELSRQFEFYNLISDENQ